MTDLREVVAGIQHDIWAHWMRYLFSMARHNPDGSVTISAEHAQRWTRQMETSYPDLTEREQESYRHQADKVLAAMGWEVVEEECDCTPENRPFCWRCQRTGVRKSTRPGTTSSAPVAAIRHLVAMVNIDTFQPRMDRPANPATRRAVEQIENWLRDLKVRP